MGDHRTLDEFSRGRSEDEQAEATTDGADSETEQSEMPDTASPNSDAGAVDSPATTYRWTPEGVACEACDSIVERQWCDSGEFVCVDCKDW